MAQAWVPDRGDLVWMNFSPQVGREQAGFRPALTLSLRAYNRRSGLALFCPVTSRAKGYAFEVLIPLGMKIDGVILADQIRSVDWRGRKVRLAGRVPQETVAEALAKVSTLFA